jgi:hypothetical protein
MPNDQHKPGLFARADWTFVNVVVGVLVGLALIALGVATIFVMVWLDQRDRGSTNNGLPTPIPVVKTNDYTPSPTPTVIIVGQPSPQPSIHPPTPSIQEPPKSGTTQLTMATNNDIGKSKANNFYEITLENASASTNPVHLDICNFGVPSGQKAIVVRFAIRLSPPPRTNEEILRLGYTQTTDFVLVDNRGKTANPTCQVTGIVLSGSGRAVSRTLAYLISADSEHVSFRFQKSGAGQPIVFDLSALN